MRQPIGTRSTVLGRQLEAPFRPAAMLRRGTLWGIALVYQRRLSEVSLRALWAKTIAIRDELAT